MWPFSSLSLASASRVGDIANFALLSSLVVGVLATFTIVQTGNVKEDAWDKEREHANERIAALTQESSRLDALATEARAQIAAADAKAAEANQKAAEANRTAEGERLARVKIEAGLASRKLDLAQAARLTSSLRAARDLIPSLSLTILGDKEAHAFGLEVVSAAKAAGINVAVSQVGIMAPPVYGIVVTDTLGGAVSGAFDAAAIPDVQYNLNSGASPTVLVGLKQPPF